MTDRLPPDALLTDGVLGVDMVLRAGESQRLDYSMKINSTGSVELPPAVAHFADTHDYCGTTISEEGTVTVNQVVHSVQTIDTPDQPATTAAPADAITETDKKSQCGLGLHVG